MSNRYSYSVPFTAEQLHADYVGAEMTQVEVAKKWGVSQKVVWRALQKAGVACRKAAVRNQRLERNKNWRGGKTLAPQSSRKSAYSDRSYVMVYDRGHPHARANGYVAEHIKVALKEAEFERLPEGYCVHHVNLKKDDNASSNLEICTHSRHQFYHTQLEELAVKLLLETGRIKFEKGVGYVEAPTS